MSIRLCVLSVATSSMLFTINAGARAVGCDYDANEEWPWVAGRTCQIREPAIGAALLANDAPANTRPDCVSADSDPDGDGWGWENQQSCRVVAQVLISHPACSSAAIDPDGDGWGWENDRSCRINTAQTKTVSHPLCSSASADPDGDGWGYENATSCRVSAEPEYPLCSVNVVDEDGDGWGFENNKSCKFIDSTDKPATDEDSDFKADSGVVFQQSFDAAPTGQYTGKQLNRDWNTPLWHLGFDQGRAHILQEEGRGNTLRITYPANAYGANGASAFLSDLEFTADLPDSYDALYISYDLKFSSGFDFVRGGKLPGLCGYDNNQSPNSGCNTGGGFPNGFDGWSARGMWREGGVLENYVYHSTQKNYYGDDEYWNVKATPGQWHQVQHHVKLNTAGKADGKLQAWFDGKKVLEQSTLVYRKTAGIGINLFYFSTFFGGNDPSWAPSEDQFIYFDNFRIATTPLPSTESSTEFSTEPSAESSTQAAQRSTEPFTELASTQQQQQNDEVPNNAAASGSDVGPASNGGGAFMLGILLLPLLRRYRLN